MEKKIAGLIGAVAALGALSTAQAAPMTTQNPAQALKASSFADLLEPIPNAADILQAVDADGSALAADNIQLVQYHHHHHHHHHGFRRGGLRIVVGPRFRRHHHHHHHHHHHFRRGYGNY